MGHLVFHYLVQDFYNPVWPNLAASAVCTTLVVLRLRAHEKLHKARHEEIKAKLAAETPG